MFLRRIEMCGNPLSLDRTPQEFQRKSCNTNPLPRQRGCSVRATSWTIRSLLTSENAGNAGIKGKEGIHADTPLGLRPRDDEQRSQG
jgi:hypothetical protein